MFLAQGADVNANDRAGRTPLQLAVQSGHKEIAAVLTYVRNSFGNKASPITAEKVKEVRAAEMGVSGLYTPQQLLLIHPHE